VSNFKAGNNSDYLQDHKFQDDWRHFLGVLIGHPLAQLLGFWIALSLTVWRFAVKVFIMECVKRDSRSKSAGRIVIRIAFA
jgi:hypothetical protein